MKVLVAFSSCEGAECSTEDPIDELGLMTSFPFNWLRWPCCTVEEPGSMASLFGGVGWMCCADEPAPLASTSLGRNGWRISHGLPGSSQLYRSEFWCCETLAAFWDTPLQTCIPHDLLDVQQRVLAQLDVVFWELEVVKRLLGSYLSTNLSPF